MTRQSGIAIASISPADERDRVFRPHAAAPKWLRMLVVLSFAIAVPGLWAQDDAEDAESQPVASDPVAMLSLTAVDRSLDHIRNAFKSIERSDMVEVMEGFIDQAGDLKGLDRSQPIGMALFLPSTLPPQPGWQLCNTSQAHASLDANRQPVTWTGFSRHECTLVEAEAWRGPGQ